MRVLIPKTAITFHTVAQAMELEKVCKACGVAGRLIPVPRQISAGCGLAWSTSVEEKESMKSFIEQHHLVIDGIYEYSSYS